ncbi:MAG TPA: hypothetical protein VM425_02990 [Myxococcota bacterium]|nr:hypothetical protein [Myxococcota bacterium]
MSEFIVEAGWGIWPVFIFGGASLFFSIYHLVSPRRDLVPLILGFGAATIIAGLLGTVTGLQHSVAYLDRVEDSQKWIFLVGLRESLNNMVAALVIACLDALTASLGSMRLARIKDRIKNSKPAEAL